MKTGYEIPAVQFETACALAEKFGHHWAKKLGHLRTTGYGDADRIKRYWVATPSRMVGGLGKGAPLWTPEAIADLTAQFDCHPVGKTCPQVGCDGLIRHRTGRDELGRTAWAVHPDGSVEIQIYRPAGVVIAARVSKPEGAYGRRRILEMECQAPAGFWPGLDHVQALAKVCEVLQVEAQLPAALESAGGDEVAASYLHMEMARALTAVKAVMWQEKKGKLLEAYLATLRWRWEVDGVYHLVDAFRALQAAGLVE